MKTGDDVERMNYERGVGDNVGRTYKELAMDSGYVSSEFVITRQDPDSTMDHRYPSKAGPRVWLPREEWRPTDMIYLVEHMERALFIRTDCKNEAIHVNERGKRDEWLEKRLWNKPRCCMSH